MKKIVQMKFGSHLYGTNTPESDLDLKSVHLPSADDILLGRGKPVISTSTGDPLAKNTADDVDDESFALQKFLAMCADGQTVTIDMLFAPARFWITNDRTWLDIVENRHRLLTRQSKSFVGYCRTQANKYGIRGSRVAAARAAKGLLENASRDLGPQPLGLLREEIEQIVAAQQHMQIINIPSQVGTDVLHWEVCDRKLPFTASIKSAYDIVARIVDQYGHRALQAEANQGVDWKALSHAVRISQQAIELLNTGNVTFPRPNADELLDIKAGKVPYAVIAAQLDLLLTEVEEAAEKSTLPEEADREWIEYMVKRAHRGVVTA